MLEIVPQYLIFALCSSVTKFQHEICLKARHVKRICPLKLVSKIGAIHTTGSQEAELPNIRGLRLLCRVTVAVDFGIVSQFLIPLETLPTTIVICIFGRNVLMNGLVLFVIYSST
jgi:hypothetical protein